MERQENRLPGSLQALLSAGLSFACGYILASKRFGGCNFIPGKLPRHWPITARAQDDFELWSALAQGKVEVADLTLCKVLLVDDTNYPLWLVLVPMQNKLKEVTDLCEEGQQLLWKEVALACRTLQRRHPGCKLNVAAIGNLVSQLHIHITARSSKDPAWPNPCYGAVPPRSMLPDDLDKERALVLEGLQAEGAHVKTVC